MTVPMIGNWTVKVIDVRPFTIHGDLYFELKVAQADQPEQVSLLRVPQHATEGQPLPGQTLSISFLMGQVTSARAFGKHDQ